jgi:MSHA biogenesis protein MshJ
MKSFSLESMSEAYNSKTQRERIVMLCVVLAVIFFSWYLISGKTLENNLHSAKMKRENLLSLSEKIMSQYDAFVKGDSLNKDIERIGKRISLIKSKMDIIDKDLQEINERTIPIGEIVLLLRDVLEANDGLSLQSMKVYPSEIVKATSANSSMKDSFEKNMISMSLKGGYSSVFSYLKKIESLKWSIYWQDVKYSVVDYPVAEVDIHLYTLSIVEEGDHGPG